MAEIQFQPVWDEKTLRGVISQYKQNPTVYPEHYKQRIRQHAEYHNVPFYEGEFSITDALTDFGTGFLEGFTTLRIGDPPDNEYEAIFKNLGHLAGFAPGILSAPLGGAAKAAAKMGIAGTTARTNALLNAAQIARSLNDKSVPMFIAKHATKKAKDIVRPALSEGFKGKSGAVQTATNFLLGKRTREGMESAIGRAKHITEGAFHLGVASGVSAWQGGVDEMMSAMIHGGMAGGVFRGIGNLINTGSEAGSKVARTLAGSLFMGLPSTMQGATTPEQVYNYVMGAWFGGQERPWTIAKAQKFEQKYRKDAEKDETLARMWEPEIHPEFEKLPPEVQSVVKESFKKTFEEQLQRDVNLSYIGQELIELGLDPAVFKDVKAAQKAILKVAKDKSLREIIESEKDEFGKGSDDVDVGELPSVDFLIGKRAENIVKRFTKDIYKNIELEGERNKLTTEIADKIRILLSEKTSDKTTEINRSDEFMNDLQAMLLKDYKFNLTPDKEGQLAGEIRQLYGRKLNDKPLRYLTSNGEDVFNVGKTTLAGDRKSGKEPAKLVDELYNTLMNLPQDKFQRAFAILDNVNLPLEKGGYEKLDMSRYRERNPEDYNNMMQNSMNKMAKEDMYYFGGKGADDRVYFYKHHPMSNTIKERDVLKYFNKKEFDILERDWLKRFPNSNEQYFRDAFKSNVLWTLSKNGLEINANNIAKILDTTYTRTLKSGKKLTISKENYDKIEDPRLQAMWSKTADFIANPIAFNKRAQVWMTDSYPAEKEFYQNANLKLNANGNFQYRIKRDLPIDVISDPKYDPLDIKTPNSRLEEGMDGAIVLHDKVVSRMIKDAGVPDSGNIKAFIISPDATHGALLGKFMFHAAGPKQSAQMDAEGTHMWVHKSAAKQMGTRELDIIYEMDPSHIKFNYGVKQGPEALRPQGIKKQIFANLVESLAFRSETKDGALMRNIVNDIFENVIESRYKGTDKANKEADAYMDKLNTASSKELIEMVDKLDFDNIGLAKIISMMHHKGNQLFVKKAYDTMLSKRKESIQEDLQSGDIATKKEAEAELRGIEEHSSLADKMINLAREAANERGIPEQQVGIFTHHMINQFRMKVLSSWIVKQATKPKINNSGTARMRPNDEALRVDADNANPRLKELETNEKLFFLDNHFKDMLIHTEIYGEKPVRLEDLYNRYLDVKKSGKNPQLEKELKETMRALTVRVPMSSMSGAQALEFAGFTGRKGHGILLHGRIMKALDGADLDGDSATFYFGGKGGFKKSWKDIYEANREEYYKTEAPAPTAVISRAMDFRDGTGGREMRPEFAGKSTMDLIESGDRTATTRTWKEKVEVGDIIEFKGDGRTLFARVTKAPYKASSISAEEWSKLEGWAPKEHAKHVANNWQYQYELYTPKKGEGKTIFTENKDPDIIKDLIREEDRPYEVNSFEALFAPNSRMEMSEAAIDGRNLLGGAAVSPKQIMSSAYDMMVKKGSDSFITVLGKPGSEKEYEVRLTPKTSPKEKDYIRRLTRAMVGLSSDPMDYAGLKSYKQWYEKMFDAFFDVKIIIPKTKKVWKTGEEAIDILGTSQLRNSGILGMIEKANSAYYGKDYANNRQWTMEERHHMTEALDKMDYSDLTTMTPKIAKLLRTVDYSDNALRRIDPDKISDLYRIYGETVEKYNWLLDILGRKTFAMPYHNDIMLTSNRKLYDSEELSLVAKNQKQWEEIVNKSSIMKMKALETNTKYEDTMSKEEMYKAHKDTRVHLLRRLADRAGEFAMKDIEQIVTMKGIASKIDALVKANPNVSQEQINAVVSDIFKFQDYLKQNSYLMNRQRYDIDPDHIQSFDKTEWQAKFRALEKARKKYKGPETQGTAEMDQAQIDAEIRNWKANRSKEEKELFDVMLLGSITRSNLVKLKELEAKTKLTRKEKKDKKKLHDASVKTRSARLGYNSEQVSRKIMKDFLGEMNAVYDEVSTQRTNKQIESESKRLVEEPQTKENQELGFPETKNPDLEIPFVEDNITGWEGVKPRKVKKSELDAETKSYIDDIITHLKTAPNNKVAQNLHFVVRDLLNKDINLMNKQDWFILKNHFDDIKRGTLWQKLAGGKFTELSERHYMQFPETINRELMRDEIGLMQREGIFLSKSGFVTGKTAKPTQFMDRAQYGIVKTGDAAVAKGDELTNNLGRKLLFLDSVQDADALHRVTVAINRELKMADEVMGNQNMHPAKRHAAAEMYKQRAREILEETQYEEKLKNKKYNVTIDGKRVSLTGEQMVNKVHQIYTDYFKEMHKLATGNVPKDVDGNTLTFKAENGEYYPMMQESIVNGVEGFTSGKKNSGYMLKKTKPFHPLIKRFPTGYYDRVTKQNPIIDIEKFTNDMNRAFAKGRKIPEEFGIDGILKIGKSMMIEMGRQNKEFTKEQLQEMYETFNPATKRISFENYWPHMHFNKATALEGLKVYAKQLRKSELTDAEVEKALRKLTYKHHALTGDWNFEDIENDKVFDEMMSNIGSAREKSEARIKWLKSLNRAGNMFGRDAHIGGWSLDRQVPVTYGKSLYNTYYRQMAQIFSRDTINKFNDSMYKRKVDQSQRDAWTTFMKLYVQGAIGNPDVIPESVINDPKMKIRKTPFGWWADNVVKNRINKIADSVGLLKKDLPKELQGVDVMDLRNWSNLEAKFELASLLAHPKSMVNNIFGGTLHTVQSTGLRTFLDARNNKKMAEINEAFSTKEGRTQFVISKGVFPDQLISEYGLHREFQSAKNEAFIKDVVRKLKQDAKLSQQAVRNMAKEHGVLEPITRWAAKFMSIPEQALRRDAFMAHYLHWYRKLGGAIKDFNNPILVELAKKGVQATQFLYNAPNRPMFARTALGKVMTRFQLWGWNAVRFRKEALRRAAVYGFKGEERERAARLMQTDLFVFALGNAFAYSLFETAMPAPWNWMQDTADWVFGDEKERNKAFFGQWPTAVAPLQMVTPPIARMPMAAMRAVLEDDWSRVSDYYIHTMYPFGRIARDFVAKNNIIDNPTSIVDKWTGVPIIGLAKASRERKKEDRKVPTPLRGLYQ